VKNQEAEKGIGGGNINDNRQGLYMNDDRANQSNTVKGKSRQTKKSSTPSDQSNSDSANDQNTRGQTQEGSRSGDATLSPSDKTNASPPATVSPIDPAIDKGSSSGAGSPSGSGGSQSTIRDPDVPNPNRIRSYEGASGKNGEHYTGGRDTNNRDTTESNSGSNGGLTVHPTEVADSTGEELG
jgi:hypothetical protein